MNSLRTDDIIGAVPRIRHMPRNYYRFGYPYKHEVIDGNNSQSRIVDYDSGHNNIHGKCNQLNHNDNMNVSGHFPLMQFDTNPFLANPKSSTQRLRHSSRNIQNSNNTSELKNYYDGQFRMQNGEVDRRQRGRMMSGERRESRSRGKRVGSVSDKDVGVGNDRGSNIVYSKQLPFINYEQLKSPIGNGQKQQ